LSKSVKVVLLILLVLIIDQVLKIYIKTNFAYGETYSLASWAKIHFVENPGMAFGIEFGGEYGKLALSLFRIVMVGFLGYYLRLLIKQGVSLGLAACFGLIFAGALGNILDSAFYGMVFTESGPYPSHDPAQLVGWGEGYGKFLYGRVVDMLHFPMFDGYFPDWLPGWGGEYFQFFRPVFNIADSAIAIGVIALLLFYRDFFSEEFREKKKGETEPVFPVENTFTDEVKEGN
jgi:signal peptidase II